MNPPANWYPDPTGRHGQRYWDGTQWTEHVFTDGVQGVDALDDTAVADSSDATTRDEQDPAADGEPDVVADAEPAPLPRRQRRATTSGEGPSDGGMDQPITGAEELFEPGDEPAADEPVTETWTPDEAAPDDEDAAVAPEVEPDDVVASVDEASEPASTDFSDAFVLAPETASRLVSRSSRGEDEAGDESVEDAGDDAVAADSAPVEDEADAPVIDAPPPTMPPPTGGPGPEPDALGISGDLVGGAFAEREDGAAVALQNSRMLRCAAAGGIIARQGTMVAYQGDVTFERQGAGGVGRALKRAATGEGLAMMRVAGDGDVFFADAGQHVFLLHLDGGPGLSVNGRNVLAFAASLDWDIERVKGASLIAGGLFNTTLRGRGWVALVSDGEPVVLRTDEAPTHVDVNALVAWSGGLSTRITNTVSARSLVGLGSGEAFQMAFDGVGLVIVQPSEGPSGGAAAT